MAKIAMPSVTVVLMSLAVMAIAQSTGLASPSSSAAASAMFVLGDSSVDCGDNTLFYDFLHSDFSLRPCQGPNSALLPNLLGEKMGLPNSIPFYTQKGSVEEVVHGVNYGSSHGTILPRGLTYQSLYHQVRQVFETFQLLQLNLTQKRYDHLIRSSVFYLSFGKDDYTDIFLSNNSGVIVKYNGQGFAHILANQMAHVIKNLYDANVRKIICMGIMPLGCAPRIVFNWNNATNASDAGKPCVQEINDFALEYNTILGERITRLNLELPDAHILFCDVYKGFMEIITNSELFGFQDAKSACCGLGPNGAMIGCLSTEMACESASDYIWWDLYNPTGRVNLLLAESAWSGEHFPSICGPTTIKDLLYNTSTGNAGGPRRRKIDTDTSHRHRFIDHPPTKLK